MAARQSALAVDLDEEIIAMANYFQNEKPQLLVDSDIAAVIQMLRKESSLTDESGIDYVDYKGVRNARNKCAKNIGSEFDSCFTAAVFLKLQSGGAVSVNLYGEYISAFAAMKQLHCALCSYDPQNTGTVSAKALEEYLETLKIFELQKMNFARLNMARKVAVRKFVFHHSRNGKIHIFDLLTSTVSVELQKIKKSLRIKAREGTDIDPFNWFSKQGIETILDAFEHMDKDKDGFISINDLLEFEGTKFSRMFLERVYEEHVLFGDRQRGMGLDKFTDFVIAWRDRISNSAIRYFFQVFDVKKRGYIDGADIHMFFKEIFSLWIDMKIDGWQDQKMCQNVVTEIFDMVRPENPKIIKRSDLEKSGKCYSFVGILSDMWEFWRHEHGELEIMSQATSQS